MRDGFGQEAVEEDGAHDPGRFARRCATAWPRRSARLGLRRDGARRGPERERWAVASPAPDTGPPRSPCRKRCETSSPRNSRVVCPPAGAVPGSKDKPSKAGKVTPEQAVAFSRDENAMRARNASRDCGIKKSGAFPMAKTYAACLVLGGLGRRDWCSPTTPKTT